MEQKDKYAAQKRYNAKRKQLRVWTDPEKYEAFKALADKNGSSVYGLINRFMDDYIVEHSGD